MHARYQTITLETGRHRNPEDGVCVMELASMLSGEPFSDHPYSVSGAIGAFLRRYNDLVDDRRRQDLYSYAAKVVGTVASPEVEDERIERLLSWADDLWMSRRWPIRCRFTTARRRRQRVSHPEAAGSYATRAIPKLSDELHAAALALVDELIAIGAPYALEAEPVRRQPERARV